MAFKLDPKDILAAIGKLDPSLIAKLLEALPLIVGLVSQFAKHDEPAPAAFDPGEVVPPPTAPLPTPIPPPPPALRAIRIALQWVNGSNARNAEFLAGGAVSWGDYIRFDVEETADQFGKQLAEADLPHPVEWFWTWDGVRGGGPVNKGANAFNEANGYACAFKVFKEHEDRERHVLAVWCRVASVESSEVSLFVD
jgi:hypothetical protein